MFNEIFFDVIAHDGVVSVTTWTNDGAHVANTWNKYLQIKNGKILIPAAWFHRTEKNINLNDKVILTVGSPEVQGKMGMGTGFVVRGTAKFLTAGEEFDMMKEKFPFLTRVVEITPAAVIQTI